ncbi:hypothetical protein [Pedobacter faecalis]|uniref:hypothetical protein n=1 Tax=Pedobacter faecalis TaxID=3041495 RepID=UPI00254B0852|nr:hypothetical protein [Pedobacter sp. ELA7]
METQDNKSNKVPAQINDDAHLENPSVDPGFENSSDDNTLKGREDKRVNDIDVNLSISEMREGKTKHDEEEGPEAAGLRDIADSDSDDDQSDDAMNRGNDRDHGAYNPKNI